MTDELIPVNLPIVDIKPAEGFGDPECMWNMREWLQKAIESNGGKQIGAGMGMGEADIDFLLEGFTYNVRIKPII